MDFAGQSDLAFSFLVVAVFGLIAECTAYYCHCKNATEKCNMKIYWSFFGLFCLLLVASAFLFAFLPKKKTNAPPQPEQQDERDQTIFKEGTGAQAMANLHTDRKLLQGQLNNYQTLGFSESLGEANAILRNNDFTQTFVRDGVGAPFSVTTNRRISTLREPDVSDSWETANLYSEYEVY